MIGTAENKAGVLSFVIKDRDTESIGRALSQAASRCELVIIVLSRSCGVLALSRR